MIFQGQIFVAWGHLGNIDKGDAGLVVFENCGADKAGGNGRNVELGTNFEEQSSHGNELSHGHAKRHILCRCRAKSDFNLEFTAPDDGAVEELENKASSGLDGDRVLFIFVAPHAGIVSVNVAVKALCQIRRFLSDSG